ncbi:hypothetical protein KEM48_000417 [Puccinia striiformis f. sp. tritici PST-130]|nr:hypothetical protein KEM48_000417 [Puccinia striiformis f. sp. tritici PST-130]
MVVRRMNPAGSACPSTRSENRAATSSAAAAAASATTATTTDTSTTQTAATASNVSSAASLNQGLHRSNSTILQDPRSATPQPNPANGNSPSHSPPKFNHSAPIVHHQQQQQQQPITNYDHPPIQFPSSSSASSINQPSPSSSRHPQKLPIKTFSSSDQPHPSPPRQRITESDKASVLDWAQKDQAFETAAFTERLQKRSIFASSYGDALNASRCDWLGEVTPNRSTGRFRLQCRSITIDWLQSENGKVAQTQT